VTVIQNLRKKRRRGSAWQRPLRSGRWGRQVQDEVDVWSFVAGNSAPLILEFNNITHWPQEAFNFSVQTSTNASKASDLLLNKAHVKMYAEHHLRGAKGLLMLETIEKTGHWNAFVGMAHQSEEGGTYGGVGILARRYLESIPLDGASQITTHGWSCESPWWTGAFFTLCKQPVFIGCLYARGGIDTVEGRSAYGEFASKMRNRLFCLAGDHNATPDEMSASGILVGITQR
jgi:hypothetical protein